MRLTTKAVLIKTKQGQGQVGKYDVVRDERYVYVADVGVTTKSAAFAAGYSVDSQVIMYRREFLDYNAIEIAGVRYRIEQTGSTGDDKFIKLLISRG